jgi:hypothetical protein
MHEMGRAFDGPVRLAHDEKGLQNEKGDSSEMGSPFCLQADGFVRSNIQQADKGSMPYKFWRRRLVNVVSFL